MTGVLVKWTTLILTPLTKIKNLVFVKSNELCLSRLPTVGDLNTHKFMIKFRIKSDVIPGILKDKYSALSVMNVTRNLQLN